MVRHPSLDAPFIAPNAIRAEKLPRNAQCWCESGKKYKLCHYRREHQDEINIYEAEKRMLREFDRGYCSYPKGAGSDCSQGISNSHTIQRRGGLNAIAEDGHVLTVKPTLQALIQHNGEPPLRRIGVSRASIFPGFCNKHDTEVFRQIEGREIELKEYNAFLFAYRSICYERFAKEVQLRVTDIQREMDRGRSVEIQEAMQQYLHGVRWGIHLGLQDVDAWKSEYDSRLISADLCGFHYAAVRFDRVLPLVGCGAFHVEYDLDGNTLQRLARRGGRFDHLALNVTAFESETVAVFGWIGDSNGPAAAFVRSFERLNRDRMADAIVRIAFEEMENIYLRQSWWEQRPDPEKAALQDRVRSGTPTTPRNANCLMDRGTSYASAAVLEVAFPA